MKNSLYILILVFLAGCVKEYEHHPNGPVPEVLIVDALLTDEVKTQKITLAWPVGQLNQEPAPVIGATMIVSNEDSDWILQEEIGNPGTFLLDSGFNAIPGKNYTLQIFYRNELYSASAGMVPGRYFSELKYEKNTGDDLYHVDFVASGFSTDFPAMWEVVIDWSMVPGYEAASFDSTHARMLFYSLPTLDVSEIFAPEVEKISFPAGSLITQRRYSITEEHAEYLRTLLLETTWQGSLFPTSNANVITNLSPGARGYFAVCAVTELSLVVE